MPLDLLVRAVALLPWAWLRRAGALIGALAGSILRIRRAQVEGALRRAGFPAAGSIAREMYASLGTAVMEFLWMVGRRGTPASLVTLTPRARAILQMHGVTTGGARGVVLATAHTGNWDLVACAAARQLPLALVTKRLRVRWLDRFWQRERAARGIRLLDGEGAFRGALHAIARGESVALMIDQVPERTSAVTRALFMGRMADCDQMPAMLAARAGVPLVLALGFRSPDGTHAVDIPLSIEPPERPSRAWLEDSTRRLNEALEAFVRERPAQWLWLHRRWKDGRALARARGSRDVRGLLSLSS